MGMHLQWLQGISAALTKNLLWQKQPAFPSTHLCECAENTNTKSCTHMHIYPWGISIATFFSFLSGHRLFTKNQKHFLWILWQVPNSLILVILAHAKLWAYVTQICLRLSCQGKYQCDMPCPLYLNPSWVIPSFFLQSDHIRAEGSPLLPSEQFSVCYPPPQAACVRDWLPLRTHRSCV